ncbi:helix-turn-helix transcriptional regulator [Solicola gregarius]|uniref:WYL domain-containing protein n=1 Tax=Solicola gregarius TaxID=2908642 RepID=A0AA46TEF0_9ACTN|nr:WYL domain-containing protein [Solicola gregarius]UYM03834.1 WYL domain-containing protein [Solicola gregarius]
MREASPLDELADAAYAHAEIAFEYESEGERGVRRVEPYRIVVHKSRSSLLTWDIERDDWRTFRIDRMSGLERATTFEPREIPDDSAAIHQLDSTPPIRTVLRFDASPSTVADRLLTQEVELESLGPERCRALVWGHSYQWLAAVVLSMGVDFGIDEPDDFRRHCETLRDRLDRALRN